MFRPCCFHLCMTRLSCVGCFAMRRTSPSLFLCAVKVHLEPGSSWTCCCSQNVCSNWTGGRAPCKWCMSSETHTGTHKYTQIYACTYAHARTRSQTHNKHYKWKYKPAESETCAWGQRYTLFSIFFVPFSLSLFIFHSLLVAAGKIVGKISKGWLMLITSISLSLSLFPFILVCATSISIK